MSQPSCSNEKVSTVMQQSNSKVENIKKTQLPAKLVLPPGKTSDLSTWTRTDVLKWIPLVLNTIQHQKTIEAFENLLYLDGDLLEMIVKHRPHSSTFGIPEEDLDTIIKHVEIVMKTPFAKQDVPSNALPHEDHCS